jgi:MFS family permease
MVAFRRGIFFTFLSIYLREFLGATNFVMTLQSSLSMIANVVGQTLIWGRVSDRFKKRRLLIISGELFASVGFLIVFWLHRYYGINHSLQAAVTTLIIGFVIIEIVWSSSNVGQMTLVADLTTDQERSAIMGKLQLMSGLGYIAGAFCSGYLYLDGEGFWNGTLFYACTGIIILSFIGMFFLPESYVTALEKNELEQELVLEIKSKEKEMQVNSSQQNLDKDSQGFNFKRVFIWLLVVLLILNVGSKSIFQIFPIHIRLEETFNVSDNTFTLMSNISSVSMILGGFVIGFLCKISNEKIMFLISTILVFIGIITLPIITFSINPSLWFLLFYLITRGLTDVWIQTTSFMMVSKIVPIEHRGKYLSYYNVTFFIAYGLGGTLIIAPIADWLISLGYADFQAYNVGFFVAAGLVGISILIYILFRPKEFKSISNSKN